MSERPDPSTGCATAVLIAVLLAGCGNADPGAAPAAAAAPPKPKAVATAAAKPAAAPENASAQEVAQQARGDLKCPPEGTAAPRADGAAVDDVLGVRPGLAFEAARAAVLCTDPLLVARDTGHRGFQLQAAQAQSVRQGFEARSAEPRVAKSGKQIMKEMQDNAMARGSNRVREDLKPGQVKWFVGTMGPPGAEQVLSVAREQRFADGASPTVGSVTDALLKKYGTPTQQQRATSAASPLLRWAYDPRGRLITETSPLYARCQGMSRADGGVNLSPDCGIVVQAMLIAPRDNPELVEYLQVGVVDQAGGYRLITAAEQALAQADAQRRAQAVDKAAKNAPKL